VYLATLADEPLEEGTLEALQSRCRQVSVELLGGSRWLRAAMSLASGNSATEGLFHSPRLRETLQQWTRDVKFDAVMVFCSSMVQYLDLPGLRNVRTVVDLVDVDSQKFFDYAVTAQWPKKWLYQLEGRRLRKLERSLPSRVDAITLVSEAEADLFRGICPNSKTVAVPNGVDLDYFRPENDGPNPWTPLPAADRTNLVFVGALDYRANIDGLTWFATEVWPLLRRELPQLTLGLVGRNPAPAVQQLASLPGIRVFGTVPDVRPYVAAADMVIAPLRIARGIQNKVLEAMAMGKPVICSPAALEGLNAEAGRDLLAADSASQWQAAIRDLLVNRESYGALHVAGRRFVENSHRWGQNLERVSELLSPAHSTLRLAPVHSLVAVH
jgi:polysaccharide biosynthesis protein PslH